MRNHFLPKNWPLDVSFQSDKYFRLKVANINPEAKRFSKSLRL